MEFLHRQRGNNPAKSQSYTNLLVRDLGDLLDRFDRGLSFEFGKMDDGTFEFIISANGIKKNIPSALALVKAAPRLKGWRVRAFRPRLSRIAGHLTFNEHTYDTQRVWYQFTHSGRKIGVKLYIEHEKPLTHDTLMGPAFILLDWAIGEYAVMTKLGQIVTERTAPTHPPTDLKLLNEFGTEFDQLTRSSAIDTNRYPQVRQ